MTDAALQLNDHACHQSLVTKLTIMYRYIFNCVTCVRVLEVLWVGDGGGGWALYLHILNGDFL